MENKKDLVRLDQMHFQNYYQILYSWALLLVKSQDHLSTQSSSSKFPKFFSNSLSDKYFFPSYLVGILNKLPLCMVRNNRKKLQNNMFAWCCRKTIRNYVTISKIYTFSITILYIQYLLTIPKCTYISSALTL